MKTSGVDITWTVLSPGPLLPSFSMLHAEKAGNGPGGGPGGEDNIRKDATNMHAGCNNEVAVTTATCISTLLPVTWSLVVSKAVCRRDDSQPFVC